jgi:hypothetical protein
MLKIVSHQWFYELKDKFILKMLSYTQGTQVLF